MSDSLKLVVIKGIVRQVGDIGNAITPRGVQLDVTATPGGVPEPVTVLGIDIPEMRALAMCIGHEVTLTITGDTTKIPGL